MGIRIPLLLLVFGRTWRLNDSGIHDCPLLEDQPPVGQGFYYESKELFMNVVVYEQVAESADGVSVRNLIAGFHTAEIRKSPAVDDLISSAFVGQVVEILQKMNPQHQLQVVGLISALSLIVARSDQLLQLSPRHDSFDLFQKFFLMRFDFFQFVAKKRQIYLFVHTLILLLFCKLFYCFVFVRCCLKFGCPDATHEQVVEAAKKACCHDFISALPQGYDTVIGEGGSTLSGGEKQRISIARAMLKDAPIILLDEATASVDPENEVHLQQAISALVKNKTLIVIAHRLSTIRDADQILVVDNGKIVEKGVHAELIQQKGIYQKFWNIRQKARNWKLAQ